MEKIKNKFKNNIFIKKKENDFFNPNSVNILNKTFSNPKPKIKDFQKGKDFKKNININDQQHSSKAFNRIWSSQNIFYANNNLEYILNPMRNTLYSSSSKIYRAPSVKDNRYEISRMMKKEKNKKINYLNNIYNTIMINESKLYRKSLYLTGFKSNTIKGKIDLKRRYNMKDMGDINNNEKIEDINIKLGIKSSFIKKRFKRNFLGYDNSLIKYKYIKKNLEEKEDSGIKSNRYINKNKKRSEIPTSSSYKTNYITKNSKLKSAKQGKSINSKINSAKQGMEDNSKLNDINMKSLSISKISTAKLRTISRGKEHIHFEKYRKDPIIYDSKNYLFQYKDNNKENSFRIYKDVEISQMRLKLNELIYKPNPKLNKNITELEKLIMRFRTFKEFQEIRLDEISKQDIKGLEQKISLLQKSLKKYNQISIDYFREMQDYIAFLNDEKSNLNHHLEGENNKRFNLYFELEKLVTNNVLKQRELEFLITIKFFLIQVKFYLRKQPKYFNTMLKEASHKHELGKLILESKIHPQNQNVIKFIESISELKEDKNQNILSLSPRTVSKTTISKFNPKKRSKKYSQIFMLRPNNNTNTSSSSNNTNTTNNEKIDKEIKKFMGKTDKIIFKNPEEFMEIINGLENKNLRLIQNINYERNNINILKREYESITKSDISEEINKEIKIKQETLKILKEEYSSLSKKYKYLTNPKLNILDSENSKRGIKDVKKGIINDIYALRSITYSKIIEKYKKKGIFLLERLLDIITTFFDSKYNEYEIDRGYDLVGKNELNKILTLNPKNIKNLSSISINEYTLCLLKLFENICEFIKYKDVEYNAIEGNRYIIHQKREEIQLQRKIQNSRNIRQLAEEKRMAGIKNILQKDIRVNALLRKILDENIVLRNKIKRNKSLAEINKYIQNYKEKEFNFYVNYDY